MKSIVRRLGIVAFSAAFAAQANAAAFLFTFKDTSGATIASGSLITSDVANAKGSYSVTSITGTVGSDSIVSLIADPYGANTAYYNLKTQAVTSTQPSGTAFSFDNLISPTATPLVDNDALLFKTGSNVYNLYSTGNTTYQLGIAPIGSTSNTTTNGVFAISPAAVPEPASWMMMIVGFGAVGYAMRRSKKVSVSFG